MGDILYETNMKNKVLSANTNNKSFLSSLKNDEPLIPSEPKISSENNFYLASISKFQACRLKKKVLSPSSTRKTRSMTGFS